MEKIPKFIKEFSKKESVEMRHETAAKIIQRRNEQRNFREKTKELKTTREEVKKLETEIDYLSSLRLGEIRNYFKLRKLRADATVGEKNYEKILRERRDIRQDKDPEQILSNFYKSEKGKWANSDYTKEDITKYFSEEHLASLSLEDYMILLQRFPSSMVAHVTRQGIRDHTGHMYHNAGIGVFADGFEKIVKDGRLRSPLGVYLVEEEKEQAIVRFLGLKDIKTKKEALESLEVFLDPQEQGQAGSFVDRMAIHFASEEVADDYYGSERGNEIFIAYPSAYVASQYYFNGQLNESGGGYWNDQWVWANEERGMDLNAGIVFIPEDVQVGRTTGSRYQLDHEKKAGINIELINKFKEIIQLPDFFEFAKKGEEILGKFNQDWTDTYIFRHNEKARENLEPLRMRVEEEFGFKDVRLQRAILNYRFLWDLCLLKESKDKSESFDDILHNIVSSTLRKEGLLYREASDTVSSKEFWEDYFSDEKHKKPSKIVYYPSGDPTLALWNWKKAARITKETKSGNLGFEEHQVPRKDTHAVKGSERFRSIAEKAIEDYFSGELKSEEI